MNIQIIPSPKKMKYQKVQEVKYTFPLCIVPNPVFEKEITSFISYAERLYGLKIKTDDNAKIRMECISGMEDEAYEIVVTEDYLILKVGNGIGVNHAFATLLQMMQIENGKIILPEVQIEDKPDCTYRCLMVDLARNWHPLSFLLTYVDMCYFYKISILHLHFTDDQSYTLPSDIFPKLSTKGRSYTKEEIFTLVKYAHERGIELMPEIDVPGHCSSFSRAYGELFGTNGIICQHEDSMSAMQNLFGELCDMFPYSQYIHIGGDEASGKMEWTKCPKCLSYAKKVGIDSGMEDREMLSELMYTHFITKMADVCFAKGKQPVVWEGFSKEVNDQISKDILVISWENYYQTTPELLQAGYKIVNCSWNPMYIVTPLTMWKQEEVFDWSIYQWLAYHPGSPYYGKTYEAPKDAPILGGQLCAWGDHIATQYETVAEGIREELHYVLERLPMLAENTWNVEKVKTYETFAAVVETLRFRVNKLL